MNSEDTLLSQFYSSEGKGGQFCSIIWCSSGTCLLSLNNPAEDSYKGDLEDPYYEWKIQLIIHSGFTQTESASFFKDHARFFHILLPICTKLHIWYCNILENHEVFKPTKRANVLIKNIQAWVIATVRTLVHLGWETTAAAIFSSALLPLSLPLLMGKHYISPPTATCSQKELQSSFSFLPFIVPVFPFLPSPPVSTRVDKKIKNMFFLNEELFTFLKVDFIILYHIKMLK